MSFLVELATGFLIESINSLVKPVIDSIRQTVTSLWGFKADLGDLGEKLQKLDDMLSGVEPGSFGDNRVTEARDHWLQRARKVVYQAEDVMDECSYELLERTLGSRSPSCDNLSSNTSRSEADVGSWGIKRRRLNPITDLSHAMFKQQMAGEIKALKESINEIYVEGLKLGINPVEDAGGRSYADHNATAMSRQRQIPYNEVLIKREGAEDDIIGRLREAGNSDKHLSVVGICGMAGIGKTTLCRSIFNTMEIKNGFEERIWICVSHDFDFIQLLNRMIEKIGDKQPSGTDDLDTLKGRLEKGMEGKKFLLVLDDIWGTFGQDWDALRGCLQNVGALKGNTILATSRLKDILEKLDATHILPLEKLSEEDSRFLFKQRVGENNLSNPTKADLGWKMLSKCEGVPLAINALGGLLKSQNSVAKWRKIEQDHDIWHQVDNFLPSSVKLSFKYLPSVTAKKCFAYCAIFKEDEVIEKDRLIQLWMAQGLLKSYDEKEQLHDEPLGEKYLSILLNYSLFQEARFDNVGNIESCKMHDVVYSLALNISKGDAEIIERRSLHLRNDWSLKRSDGSIVSFDITRKEDFITKTTKCLRVLSLVAVGLEELPDWIGELKHLRYLDISKNKIKCLPVGLGKLYHLQTLRFLVGFDFPPREWWGMPTLPKEFTTLPNLRHLCSNVSMPIPVDLGMLTSLQTLPPIDVDNHSWGGRACELGNLQNLTGLLDLRGFRDAGIIEDLKKVKLGTKEQIQRLTLYFRSHFNVNEENVNHVTMLEALQPHSNLGALEIRGYKSKALPKWMMEMTGHQDAPLQNLVSLSISECSVLKELPSMKNLSALKVLKIWDCGRATSLQNLEYLTSLQTLELSSCHEMENLPDTIRYLVCLEKLSITDCLKMSCLPVGLSNLPKLKTLRISLLSRNVRIFPFPNLNDHSPLSASLRELEMNAFGMDKVKNLPNQIQHLRELRSLTIEHFQYLKELPEWLGKLTSLEILELKNLPSVEHLPSQLAMEHLSRLTTLRVFHCPRLEDSCRTPNGSEWIKIQKIRHVEIP